MVVEQQQVTVRALEARLLEAKTNLRESVEEQTQMQGDLRRHLEFHGMRRSELIELAEVVLALEDRK